MDAFQIIQHFFSRMHCQHCDVGFSREDIELLRREESVYVVNVFCHKCDTQNGVALVGLESSLEDASLEGLSEFNIEDLELEAAELDADFDEAFSAFTPGANAKRAKNAIPEDLLMQLLGQAGALPPELQKLQKQQAQNKRRRFKDPELTRQERERLAQFSAVNENDLLDAHYFFQGLDEHWMRHVPQNLIPEEMRQSQTGLHTESQAD